MSNPISGPGGGGITEVSGVAVGHAEDRIAKTGCTVVLVPPRTMGGIAVRGSAPAARELDLLRIDGITREVHAVLLTGGSAFGLDAAGGVLAWLEERGIGFDAGVARVPLVPTLSLFDLAVGSPDTRPDKVMGRRACDSASTDPPAQGAVGAGTGATVGKLLGMEFCSASGIGTSSLRRGKLVVGAIGVSNAFGDLVSRGGEILAGARNPENHGRFINTAAYLRGGGAGTGAFANCTFAVVATNAGLDRRLANRLAEMAAAGLAATIRPAHTIFDFDAVIALSCGEVEADLTALGSMAAEVVSESLLAGAVAASGA